MINIDYPGTLVDFYVLMAKYSEMDMLQGPLIYETYLDLEETEPYSDNFELMGTGD